MLSHFAVTANEFQSAVLILNHDKADQNQLYFPSHEKRGVLEGDAVGPLVEDKFLLE